MARERRLGRATGIRPAALAEADRRAVRLLEDVRDEFDTDETRVVISGCIGPRRDGYDHAEAMSADEAEVYHGPQIEIFAGTAADMVAALTLTNTEEATGIARAAARAGLPVAISFTIETDGRLASGRSLGSAVKAIDAATAAYPSYYMINCAHPSHFEAVLDADEPWVARLRGLRANASPLSHAEPDEAPEPDAGDPESSAASTRRSSCVFRGSPSLGAAAAPTTATSSTSRPRARRCSVGTGRHGRERVQRSLLALLLVASACLAGRRWPAPPGSGEAAAADPRLPLARATAPRPGLRGARHDLEVEGRGHVVRVLADDRQGARHQRFIVRLASGQTLLIAHNIDVAPRVQGLSRVTRSPSVASTSGATRAGRPLDSSRPRRRAHGGLDPA